MQYAFCHVLVTVMYRQHYSVILQCKMYWCLNSVFYVWDSAIKDFFMNNVALKAVHNIRNKIYVSIILYLRKKKNTA